ncbi:hypothetical protein ACFSTA_06645 [Ornithinibacillus salinisoli]|uniref:Uncharacterized protein n=1 Tax=Ornithinibacillus salinisoli TaxID=1848459 RepID=A0ABW4W0L2_9BACI
MGIIDWASNKVQTFTGEEERRELVEKFKEVHTEHKSVVYTKVNKLNHFIQEFNNRIQQLNIFRRDKVKIKIGNLRDFLVTFGNIDQQIIFAIEEQKEIISLSSKDFESTDNYITDIDWSKDDVFKKTFLKTIFGARSETRRQNLTMKEHLNEYQLEIKSREKQIEFKQQKVITDTKISDLYSSTIVIVDHTIKEKIIPEMELVGAMLEAESIKNMIIADKDPTNATINKDISLLKDTVYSRHYHFVRNSLLFFILCTKIYNTPILTKLLNEEASDHDYKQLENQKNILLEQDSKLSLNMMEE